MSSKSIVSFQNALTSADLLLQDLPSNGPESVLTSSYKQIRFRAHLAASVASWEAYVEAVTEEFLLAYGKKARKPLESALHQLLLAEQERARGSFNTPNWENCRTHISRYTGFDVLPLWTWPKGQLTTPIAAQQRLNEILTVRHSFAHGFSLPAFSWLEKRPTGMWLSVVVCRRVSEFLKHLSAQTDLGLEGQLQKTLGQTVTW
ncbi:HEPN domain-containing protein [Lentzea sp. E54]|uniref:HEPN domain-containing protein n=1 Tax=Lentzea xerophila TaxID=3435883 RepID=UPI003DA5D2BC